MDHTPMSDEQKYLFDLQGYIVLKNAIPQAYLQAANAVLDRLVDLPEADYPYPLRLGDARTPSNLYISNILEADPAMRRFMHLPAVNGVIDAVTSGPWRLNHTYTIYRWGMGHTNLHMGGTPTVFKCQYHVHDRHIYSTLTKAVYPLLPCGPEDGCFAVIPGSHKSAFPRPWGNHPEENPALVPVIAEPGDAIVFTEALAHGSMVNRSGRERRTLYYCYSVGYMPDWPSQGMEFSPALAAQLTPEERAMIALK